MLVTDSRRASLCFDGNADGNAIGRLPLSAAAPRDRFPQPVRCRGSRRLGIGGGIGRGL